MEGIERAQNLMHFNTNWTALLDIVQEALEYMCRLEAGQEHEKVMTCYPDDCVEPCGYWEECTYRRQMNALIALRNFREGESDG